MEHTDVLEAFRNFLIENDCLEAYINLEHARTSVPRDTLRSICGAITNIAQWSITKEGNKYWEELDSIWQYTDLNYKVSITDILTYLKANPVDTPYEYW